MPSGVIQLQLQLFLVYILTRHVKLIESWSRQHTRLMARSVCTMGINMLTPLPTPVTGCVKSTQVECCVHERQIPSQVPPPRQGSLSAQTHQSHQCRTSEGWLFALPPVACASQPEKAALEHTANTAGDGQLAYRSCARARGNASSYDQLATVCIRHSVRTTGRLQAVDKSKAETDRWRITDSQSSVSGPSPALSF